MFNNPKKIVAIAGMIVGLVIIIIGICLHNAAIYSVGKHIQFGADFYTEMYAVTKDVGRSIQYTINEAVGWLIICLGAIDICLFADKFVNACKESGNQTQEGVRPVITYASAQTTVTQAKQVVTNEQAENVSRVTTPQNDETWTCSKCGHVNPNGMMYCENCGRNLQNNVTNTLPRETENAVYENYWTCGKCKQNNSSTRNTCWACGNAKR